MVRYILQMQSPHDDLGHGLANAGAYFPLISIPTITNTNAPVFATKVKEGLRAPAMMRIRLVSKCGCEGPFTNDVSSGGGLDKF